MNGQIRDMLIQAAHGRRVVCYAEVAQVLDLDMHNAAHRWQIGLILGEISTEEHNSGRPLLSAVVVHQEDHRPGRGFYTLARELEIIRPDENEEVFYNRELDRVFNCWAGGP